MANAEIAALRVLFSSVLEDLKNTNWEALCKKGLKLSDALCVAAQEIGSFVNSIQTVSDNANNARGAARDIGATLTRFVLRHRALEKDMRLMAAAITEEFVGGLGNKAPNWRHRLTDIERRHHKNLKKAQGKKAVPDSNIVQEHKIGCSELLIEQRHQYVTFSSLLLPVLESEVRMLEEGLHFKEVLNSINLNSQSDVQSHVNVAMEDICNNRSDWAARLPSLDDRGPQKKALSHVGSDKMSSPSTSISDINWDSASTYCSVVNNANRRPVFDDTKSQASGEPIYWRSDDRQNEFVHNGDNISLTTTSNSPISSRHERVENESQLAFHQLNSDIDALCRTLTHTPRTADNSLSLAETAVLPPVNQRLNEVRRRPSSIRPPPPPIRRNSAITAATPTAPSIVDLRNAGLINSRGSISSFSRTASMRTLSQESNASAENRPYYETNGTQYCNSEVRNSSEGLPGPPGCHPERFSSYSYGSQI